MILFEAQGYVTAQDRLWQMDMARRMAAGEAAELLGPKLVDHDRTERVLGIRANAERLTTTLSERDKKYFEDFARGVNAFIDQASARICRRSFACCATSRSRGSRWTRCWW